MIDCGDCGMSDCSHCKRRKARERYWRLKKEGLDPNKVRINPPEPALPPVDLTFEAMLCNHCGVGLPDIKALVKHKEAHGFFRKPMEQYSLTPSCATWNG